MNHMPHVSSPDPVVVATALLIILEKWSPFVPAQLAVGAPV